MSEKACYCIQTIDSGTDRDYYVTEGKGGRALLIFRKSHYSVLTPQGWQENTHQGLQNVEISADREHVLVFYTGKEQPLVLAIPDVGPEVLKLTESHVEQVLKQMQSRGLTYDDFWEEYYEGINTTYAFDRQKKKFTVTRIDIVAASFMTVEEINTAELKCFLLENASLHDLRKQGFKI